MLVQIKAAAIDPSLLVVEVTEHAALNNLATGGLLALQACGILIALDDLGSGFNSLQRFTLNHYNFIKLDGIFIRKLLDRHIDNQAVVEGVLTIAAQSKTPIICESVESELHEKAILEIVDGNPVLRSLTPNGLLLMQGWHYGKDQPC